jgi:hypothetical protein
MMEKAVNAIIALVGALLAVLVGLMWSREVLSRGTFGFDMGYLAVALGVSWGLAAKVRRIPLKLLPRLSLLAPIVSVFAFEAMADYTLNRLRDQLSARYLFLFATFSAVMLLTVLMLLVRFDYEEAFGPFSPHERRSWRKWVLAAAMALAILVIWGPTRILMALQKAPAILPAGILRNALVELESWFYRCSLIVYLFLIVRMVSPTLHDRIVGSRHDDPDVWAGR